jgi:hypothetical protein
VTFTPPLPWSQLAWIAGALAALTIVAYILKMRRRRHEVPFSKLWQRVLAEKESQALWKRLKRLVSLALQLLFLALVLGAALDPRTGAAETGGRHLVVIVDASASMKAKDGEGGKTRIETARAKAAEILSGLGGADHAMVVRMDGQATALTRFEADAARLAKAASGIEASDTPADLSRALQAAADALRGRKDPMIVLVGDGAYPEEARARVKLAPGAAPLGTVDLAGIDVRFVPVGSVARNVGIVAFNVRRYLANKLSYEVLVEIENFGAAPEEVRLDLFAGDDPIDVKTLALAPRERQRLIYPDLGGGDDRALRAQLTATGGDALPLDDTAWALLPERKKQRVLVVTNDNLYLEAALLLDPNISVDKIRPADYAGELAAGRLAGYQVAVFDAFAPDAPPPMPGAIYFAPPPEKSPVAARGALERPYITDVNPDHPLTRWVTLGDVNIDRASVLAPGPGDVVIARSVRDPLIVAGRRDGRKMVTFGFALDATDLTLRVAFPVLLVNALDWFAGDDAELITTYKTGRAWSVPVDPDEKLREVEVRGPSGTLRAPVQNGRARIFGDRVGVYEIVTPDGTLGLAANLANPEESAVAPVTSLALGGKTLEAPPAFRPSVSRSLWMILALAALVLSSIEWWTYNRRVTV